MILVKHVNVLAGYASAFSMTIDIRPRYWRIVLKEECGQFPSLRDQNFE